MVSTVEDAGAVSMALVAIFLPVLVALVLVVLVVAAVWMLRRRAGLRRERGRARP